MISGERKKFKLSSTRKPLLIDGMSNTVIVQEDGKQYYCHIAFDASLVHAVGQQLARGVSSQEIAFLLVRKLASGEWSVSACYLETWEETTMWMATEKPSWIKELKPIRCNHGNHSSTHTARRASGNTDQSRSTTAATALQSN